MRWTYIQWIRDWRVNGRAAFRTVLLPEDNGRLHDFSGRDEVESAGEFNRPLSSGNRTVRKKCLVVPMHNTFWRKKTFACKISTFNTFRYEQFINEINNLILAKNMMILCTVGQEIINRYSCTTNINWGLITEVMRLSTDYRPCTTKQ